MKNHHPCVLLTKNEKFGDDLFKLTFQSAEIASNLKPGNFVHIKVTPQMDPLFRRAMSVHSCNGDSFTVFFRVVGRGTKLLSEFREGDELDLLGPLGNSFMLPGSEDIPIMVAGGTGIPPLHFYATLLLRQSIGNRDGIRFLCGISSKSDLPLVRDVQALGVDVKLSSDDGSVGHHGFVTDILEAELSDIDSNRAVVYSCGPENMLRAVAAICLESNIRCQVSLEGSMPCGLGTCLGCVVRSTESDTEFKRICKEGPVFNAGEVKI
ncbi:MAG: dihydroorotate dehydrogenase electron transfer subunit [candidate division Zixibacteria bacterium]|nr:dihydroorotate dehydrogenase electron transfer subunit [candidate division Zixibacteria bacterium]MBU1472090.1 dihydroorotate dehydrogenase electron transfer subunit [candidate division Zixibacteria bacterium]MBU2626190.1 dihydroorotate dehydrogenase electron transfer subunit [candidate division Zixibacteria bacterium]